MPRIPLILIFDIQFDDIIKTFYFIIINQPNNFYLLLTFYFNLIYQNLIII